jgi:hypothetical protein
VSDRGSEMYDYDSLMGGVCGTVSEGVEVYMNGVGG